MVRRIGFWSLGVLGVLALAVSLGVRMLLPPDVPVPPRADRMIAGVTIWNPGEPLQPDQTIICQWTPSVTS